ncbi:MAG: nascent polypeptide-associated complex protein [Theionarchaea archaeon]|nr:MAG: nascent polypeptide-associated complex protein [Theionarchaea archaeon DG-70]MBU7011207.1 nascent polypeptide-associated complex protein [Theionarchaea archaeon]
MFDQKKMRKLMKRAGVKMTEIEAEEVIIKTPDEEYVFKNPDVAVISAAGQKTFQLSGNYITRRRKKEIPEKDIKLVAERANCTAEEAEKSLREAEGDIAAAILQLTKE